MKAEELKEKYALRPHVENGAFAECHYENHAPGRAASGSIYYYVGADELTAFHRIDCDEYWCYVAGETLAVWLVDENGAVNKMLLGVEDGAAPIIYLRKGVLFASRHLRGAQDGTFMTCITVPRFAEAGFEMFSRDEMLRRYPALAEFYAP